MRFLKLNSLSNVTATNQYESFFTKNIVSSFTTQRNLAKPPRDFAGNSTCYELSIYLMWT